MSRLDVKTGFVLLNVLSALGSGALLFRFLLREGLDRQRAALAVLWWSILPLGIRWIFFYPAIPDMFGFFLLTALIVNAVERRYLLFALLLPIGVLSRENLAMLVPFLWLITFRAEGWRRGTAITLAVAALGVAAFFLVRAFPPIVPADVYPNWLAAHRIDVNISRITQNIDGGAWRLLLAAPLSLGLLVVIPMLRWRHGLALLRMRVEWLYFVVATVAVTIIGGWDDDRYLFSLTPLLLLLTFGDRGVRWSPAGRIIALTVLQLVMVRFAWPVSGAQQHDYFQYTVAFMDQSRMWSLAALALGVAVLATLLMMLPKTRTTLPPGSVR